MASLFFSSMLMYVTMAFHPKKQTVLRLYPLESVATNRCQASATYRPPSTWKCPQNVIHKSSPWTAGMGMRWLRSTNYPTASPETTMHRLSLKSMKKEKLQSRVISPQLQDRKFNTRYIKQLSILRGFIRATSGVHCCN